MLNTDSASFGPVRRDRSLPLSGDMKLPPPFVADQSKPEQYVMDEALENAANTAIALGQPLLLTGDPGTGKTQFSHHLAWQLGLDKPLEFHTKSSSVASDLFYTYDTVRRFHAAHREASADERDYIHFNALGRAVILSLPADAAHRVCRPTDHAAQQGPRRSVVLIDEIDKASRDFPNDLLHELSAMSFRIPELNVKIDSDPSYRPIVVVTSNRERPLPDAFLRRCVYHNIEFPDESRLVKILCARFGYDASAPPALATSAVELYGNLQKKMARAPSTAELVAWYSLLQAVSGQSDVGVSTLGDHLRRSVSALAKNRDDHKLMLGIIASARS